MMEERELIVNDRMNAVPTLNDDDRNVGLMSDETLETLRERWDEIQTAFVDEPQGAVEKADRLVDETVRRLTESFARERADLELTWSRGEQVTTEDLRLALQRYRSFFSRLLSR